MIAPRPEDHFNEFWVNVYSMPSKSNFLGPTWYRWIDAVESSIWFESASDGKHKTLYRIHVKMDGGYNRDKSLYRRYMDKINKPAMKITPKYERGFVKDNWMG